MVGVVQSTGWKLQREIVLLLAWGPAILLQLAHPLVAQGIADHSAFRTQRHGRVRRLFGTVDAMLQLSFGTEPQARAVLARINGIHDRVNGRLSGAAGAFSAGTPYTAHDPALLAWVHATLLDMNLRVYERYVAPLSVEEKDRYCAEASTIEAPLGIPAGRLPRNFGELSRHMDAMLASATITVTTTRAYSLATFSTRRLHAWPCRSSRWCACRPWACCRHGSGRSTACLGAHGGRGCCACRPASLGRCSG